MSIRSSKWAAVGLALTFGVTACSNVDTPSGPGEQAFDAAETQAQLAQVDASFDTPAFQSLAVLGGSFGSSAGAVASAAAEMLDVSTPGSVSLAGLASAASDRMRMAYASASASLAPIIPAAWLGNTYVYDPVTEAYVLDPEATGAPANGIRFILYAVNPITDAVIVDTEIGYADVLDVGTTNSTAVQLILVSGGVTYLDYTITATGVINAPVFEIAGFITDGTERVDFTLRHAIQVTIGDATVNIDYDISTNTEFSVLVAVVLTGTEANSNVSVNITLEHQANTVTLIGSVENGSGTIEVTGNGQLFAIITIIPDGVTVTDQDGNPISQEQHEALARIWKVVEDVFEVFDDLFDPIEWLFNFGG